MLIVLGFCLLSLLAIRNPNAAASRPKNRNLDELPWSSANGVARKKQSTSERTRRLLLPENGERHRMLRPGLQDTLRRRYYQKLRKTTPLFPANKRNTRTPRDGSSSSVKRRSIELKKLRSILIIDTNPSSAECRIYDQNANRYSYKHEAGCRELNRQNHLIRQERLGCYKFIVGEGQSLLPKQYWNYCNSPRETLRFVTHSGKCLPTWSQSSTSQRYYLDSRCLTEERDVESPLKRATYVLEFVAETNVTNICNVYNSSTGRKIESEISCLHAPHPNLLRTEHGCYASNKIDKMCYTKIVRLADCSVKNHNNRVYYFDSSSGQCLIHWGRGDKMTISYSTMKACRDQNRAKMHRNSERGGRYRSIFCLEPLEINGLLNTSYVSTQTRNKRNFDAGASHGAVRTRQPIRIVNRNVSGCRVFDPDTKRYTNSSRCRGLSNVDHLVRREKVGCFRSNVGQPSHVLPPRYWHLCNSPRQNLTFIIEKDKCRPTWSENLADKRVYYSDSECSIVERNDAITDERDNHVPTFVVEFTENKTSCRVFNRSTGQLISSELPCHLAPKPSILRTEAGCYAPEKVVGSAICYGIKVPLTECLVRNHNERYYYFDVSIGECKIQWGPDTQPSSYSSMKACRTHEIDLHPEQQNRKISLERSARHNVCFNLPEENVTMKSYAVECFYRCDMSKQDMCRRTRACRKDSKICEIMSLPTEKANSYPLAFDGKIYRCDDSFVQCDVTYYPGLDCHDKEFRCRVCRPEEAERYIKKSTEILCAGYCNKKSFVRCWNPRISSKPEGMQIYQCSNDRCSERNSYQEGFTVCERNPLEGSLSDRSYRNQNESVRKSPSISKFIPNPQVRISRIKPLLKQIPLLMTVMQKERPLKLNSASHTVHNAPRKPRLNFPSLRMPQRPLPDLDVSNETDDFEYRKRDIDSGESIESDVAIGDTYSAVPDLPFSPDNIRAYRDLLTNAGQRHRPVLHIPETCLLNGKIFGPDSCLRTRPFIESLNKASYTLMLSDVKKLKRLEDRLSSRTDIQYDDILPQALRMWQNLDNYSNAHLIIVLGKILTGGNTCQFLTEYLPVSEDHFVKYTQPCFSLGDLLVRSYEVQ